MTVKGDMDLNYFLGFFLICFIWLPVPRLAQSPRFSLLMSHTMTPLMTLGLVYLFLTSFWSLVSLRQALVSPMSSSVHSKYLLKRPYLFKIFVGDECSYQCSWWTGILHFEQKFKDCMVIYL